MWYPCNDVTLSFLKALSGHSLCSLCCQRAVGVSQELDWDARQSCYGVYVTFSG